MDEFGRRFVSLVGGTTLGMVLATLLFPDSTSLLAYAAAILATAIATTALYRSRWLES